MTLGLRAGADEYVSGHGDTSYDVTHYALELTYSVHGNHLEGRATLKIKAVEEIDRVELDLHALNVRKVSVDGAAVKYSDKRNRLSVRLPKTIRAGRSAEITVRYSGNPKPIRKRHLGLAGWEELSDGVIVAGQPHGAPSWFPCNDRPSSKAGYRISVTTSSDYAVISNGELVEQRRGSRMTTWVYEQRQPMAPYLATVQIGRYDVVDVDGGPVPLRSAVPHAVRDKFDEAFGRQAEMVEYYSDVFGDYPFDGYTVVVTEDALEIPLESQSLSTFGSNYLRPDWDAVRLVAHELSHQWFGNSLTVQSWKDIWLHEGFACYAEWLWSEHVGERDADSHAREHWKRLDGLDQDLVLSDPGPDLMFDDRVYKRGALFLHALRLTMGDKTFFRLLSSWAADHAYGTVTTEMFVEHLGAHTDADVEPLVQGWLMEEALPKLPRSS